MRKIYILALALLTAVSCLKEEEPFVQDQDGVETSFEATREGFGGAGTKTVLRYDYSVDWLSGDNIGLFDGTDIVRSNYTMANAVAEAGWKLAYRFKAASYGKASKFSYDYYSNDSEDVKEYAVPETKGSYLLVYPWGNNFIANPSTSEFRTWIDDDQTPSEGTYQANRGFAVARTDDLSKGVIFRNAVTLLEFEIPLELDGKIVKVAVKGNASEVLAGDILIKYNDDETVTVGSWDDAYKSLEDKSAYKEVRFSASSNAALATPLSAGKYYLVVMPQTLSSGLTVTATDLNGNTYIRKSDKAVELKVGYIYGMGKISAASYATEGVASLPYMFSLYGTTGSSNVCKYLRSVKGTVKDSKTAVLGKIMHYDDKTGASLQVSYSGVTTSGGTDYYRNTDIWSDAAGFDNIPVKSMISEESAALADYGYPGENCYMLTLPLQTDLPSSFDVSFGLYIDGGLADWNVYVSDSSDDFDGDGILDSEDASVTPMTQVNVPATKTNFYYTVNVSHSRKYITGRTLYVKLSPTGTRYVTGSTGSGWNKQSSLHSGFLISEALPADNHTPVSENHIYWEPFDDCRSGIDYLIGEKLCNMANCCGAEVEGQTNVYERPGYVQIGYVNYQIPKATGTYYNALQNTVGCFRTPSLAEGDLTLTFKAMAYQNPGGRRTHANTHIPDIDGDITSIVVNVVGGGTVNGQTSVTVSGLDYLEFKDFALEIKGATPQTSIEFTSAPGENGFSRWFIDDISVCKSEVPVSELKFMSFNISNSNNEEVGWNDDDPKKWTVRRHAVKSMLAAEKPAVIGMQEVTSVQYSDMTGFGYGGYGVGRATGGTDAESGEMCAIFYDASQVTMGERKGTFWLNPSGTVGEKGWDAAYVRIASWAEFTVKKTGKRFIFLNTHLDNSGKEARRQSVRMIARKLKEINADCLPAVVTGDFNNPADHYIMDAFRGVVDGVRESAPVTDDEYTYTAWDGSGTKVIDHIFSRGFNIKEYRTVTDRSYIGIGNFIIFDTDVPCPYLSDHDPITAVLEL